MCIRDRSSEVLNTSAPGISAVSPEEVGVPSTSARIWAAFLNPEPLYPLNIICPNTSLSWTAVADSRLPLPFCKNNLEESASFENLLNASEASALCYNWILGVTQVLSCLVTLPVTSCPNT